MEDNEDSAERNIGYALVPADDSQWPETLVCNSRPIGSGRARPLEDESWMKQIENLLFQNGKEL